ncbi:MAG: nicotinamide-nucleotide amidohydrolase family protein [Gammaproteobacteria bacterium]
MRAAPPQAEVEARAREVGAALAERGWRAATAESCTGGWIAQCVTAIPGSSAWFEAGLVTYSNAAKVALLGIDAMVLERYGAVSEQTACAMARGALRVTGADIACAVTGVAGPGGGSAAKPVGLVCFGFAAASAAPYALSEQFPGGRRDVRAHSVARALDELLALVC